jgi:ribosome-associated protein
VTERLREVVASALVVPRPRRRTKPTRASKLARVEAKRRRAAVKRERRRPRDED